MLSAVKAENTPSLSYLRGKSTLQSYLHRRLYCLSLPEDILLVSNIDDTVLTRPGEQEVATTLKKLVRHSGSGGWETNPTNIQRPSTSVKFLRAQ